MAKEIDLLGYWMPLLRKLKEFKEIANAETPELKYILEAIDRTLDNMFIETADEYGIKRLESMMGLYPEVGDSLETRRFRVQVKWNDKVPYTDAELYNRMISLCGSADKFEIVEHYSDYLIEITTNLGIVGAFDEVASLLQEMLPCNIVLNLNNILKSEKTTTLWVGSVTNTAMSYLITNDINKGYLGDVSMYYGVGVANAETHTITNDITCEVSTTSPLNEAVALSTAGSNVVTHDIEVEDTLEGSLNEAVAIGIATTRIITHDISSSANVTGNSTVASPVNTATVITINS